MSDQIDQSTGRAGGNEAAQAAGETPAAAPPAPVAEEERLLETVLAHLARVAEKQRMEIDFDRDLLELRDQMMESRLEDRAILVEHMYRIAALAQQRGQAAEVAVEPSSPYFGHIRLEEDGRRRDVLIGKRTYLAPGGGVRIVDWRNAPVSRVFYQYREGEDYQEEFGGREVEGVVLARRAVSIGDGVLRRVSSDDETYLKDADGAWHTFDSERWALEGGAGSAARPRRSSASSGRLGEGGGKVVRADKHLPDIAALIDAEQFGLITQPDSGLVVVQGVAGSGKTTVGLHRMAWLAFRDKRRFRGEAMRAIVYSRALKDYISRVLPDLGVEGVVVQTYAEWAHKIRRDLVKRLPERIADDTPSVVTRLKKHPAMLRILQERVDLVADQIGQRLREAVAGGPDEELITHAWEQTRARTLYGRVRWMLDWLDRKDTIAGAKRKKLSRKGNVALDYLLPKLEHVAYDVVTVWEELLTDLGALTEAFDRHAPGDFQPGHLKRVHRWCVRQHSVRNSERGEDEAGEAACIDAEDDTLLLRLHQIQRGPIKAGGGRSGKGKGKSRRKLRLSHLFVDEAQDLSPVELQTLLEIVDKKRCVTLAGDPAQRMHADNGFESWEATLEILGLSGLSVQPLRVAYRSTAEIMTFAREVLGPLADSEDRFEVTRHGAPVELFRFSDNGEAVGFLADALRRLRDAEPTSNVAVITRSPSSADLFYEGLVRAEVPRIRRVREQDFSFAPGIEVTDIYQVKGLEFDYVVLLDCDTERYPLTDEARYLLHIGATRAAHQLWLVAVGDPSPVLPPEMHTGFEV